MCHLRTRCLGLEHPVSLYDGEILWTDHNLGLLFEVLRHRKRLDPLRPEKAADIDRDDMARYLSRIVGEEALEYLLAPAFSCWPEGESMPA